MKLRNAYVQQLGQLDEEITEMASHISATFAKAKAAAETGAVEDLDSVESIASSLAYEEREIESLALRLLLLQQPVAKDLREVSGALKVVTDFKRIGDMSLDICRLVGGLEGRTFDIQKDDLTKMADLVTKMIEEATVSYHERDIDKAMAAAAMDDEVDGYMAAVRDAIIQAIFDKRVDAKDGVDLLMIAKYFERIADHAESIAYWTEYVVKGTRKGEPLTATE